MNRITLHEQQRRLREEAIVDAAYELMSKQGYAEMSMDELAAHVGISKATLYQHFASKDDLVVHVIVRAMQRSEAALETVDARLPAVTRLELSLRRGIEGRAGLWAFRMNVLPMCIVTHPRFQEQYRHMTAMITELVDAAKREGSVDMTIPTTIIVRLLSGLFRNDYEEVLRSGEVTLQELSATLVRIVLNGIRTGDRGNEAPQTDASRN